MHRASRRTRQMAPLHALRASCSKSYGLHEQVYVSEERHRVMPLAVPTLALHTSEIIDDYC